MLYPKLDKHELLEAVSDATAGVVLKNGINDLVAEVSHHTLDDLGTPFLCNQLCVRVYVNGDTVYIERYYSLKELN